MVPSEAGNPLDGVPDLDLATADLAHREEALRQELERTQQLLAATAEHADTLGTGYAEDGAVRITVDANQRVVGVGLDPRALRLGSVNRLEHAVLDACQAAQDDVARRLGRTAADPIRHFLDSMPELTQLLPESSYAALLEDGADRPESDRPRSNGASRRPRPPQERSMYE